MGRASGSRADRAAGVRAARTSSTSCATTCSPTRRRCSTSRSTPGAVTEAGLRQNVERRHPATSRRGWRRRRGRDLQPDGGRRDGGDLALAGLAVAAPRPRRASTRCARRSTREMEELRDVPRALDEARELFERVALDDDFVEFLTAAGVRAHRLKRSRRVEDDQAGRRARSRATGSRRAGRASNATTAPRTSCGCAARSRSSTRSRGAAPSACGSSCTSAVRHRARRADRQPGGAAGQGRAEGDLPQRLAGRRRREPRRDDVPRPDALPGELGADGRAPDQQRAAARRPDPRGPRASTTSTGSRRSSPTPRPASAGR